MQLCTAVRAQGKEVRQKATYRLIIFDPAGTGVLLESQGNEYRLPKIEIPKFTRPAHEVTEHLRNSWKVSSVFLFSGVMEESPNASYFAVLRSRDKIHMHPPDMHWFTIHHALSLLLLSGDERRALKSSYARLTNRIR